MSMSKHGRGEGLHILVEIIRKGIAYRLSQFFRIFL